MSTTLKSSINWTSFAVLAAMLLGGCDSSGDMLPGRTRPVLKHGWPHPRDLKLSQLSFTPANPNDALFQAQSGVRAFVVPGESDPLVRLTAAIPLGRLYESAGEAGASELLTRLLTNSRQLSLRLADLGSGLEVEQTLDATRISFDVLPEDWHAGLDLLIGMLAEPDLNAAAIQQYRVGPGHDTPMAGIDGEGFRPKVELARRVYGYPLAPPTAGTTVTPAAVRALASRTLRPDRVVLGVGGNIARKDVEAAIEAASRSWQRGTGAAPAPAAIAPRQTEQGFYTVEVPSLEGWIAIGKVTGPVADADRAPLAAMGFILSERLNVAAREIRGLANRDAFLLPETGSGAGLLQIRTGGRPEAVGPLVHFSWDEIQRLYDPKKPVTDEELARAKGWLIDSDWRAKLEGATRASATFALEQVRRGGTEQLDELAQGGAGDHGGASQSDGPAPARPREHGHGRRRATDGNPRRASSPVAGIVRQPGGPAGWRAVAGRPAGNKRRAGGQ